MFDDFDFDDPFADDGYEDELETARTLKKNLRAERKDAKRTFVNGLKKQALNELIPTLPPPDTDVYVVSNGAGAEVRHGINPKAFDFGTFIPHLVEMLGNSDCTLYVSTWVMNRNHANTLIEMLNDKRIAALTVVTDPYFKRREAAVCTTLLNGMEPFGKAARFIAFKNHVKAICIANADNTRFVTVTGSANLSAQPRCEQYILTTAPDVYQFFVTEFFEAMFDHGGKSV